MIIKNGWVQWLVNKQITEPFKNCFVLIILNLSLKPQYFLQSHRVCCMEHGVQFSCVNGLIIVLLKVYSVMFTDNNVLIDLSSSWHSLMVRWVVGSILHGVDPLSYFSFQPVLHDWCNKGRGVCYPVCGIVHIKEPLLLIDKSSLCGGSRFPFSLSEWSLTICLTPYNRR